MDYSAIIRCAEIRGNCCAFRATVIRVYVFTVFLNEVNVRGGLISLWLYKENNELRD
jgi:hypothetical protein